MQELVGGSPSANMLPGLGLDEWLTRTDSGGTRHFLTDVLGSTLALADGSGAVQTEYTYEPFGKATVSGTSSANGFQFTGRENDGTGLFYYRARYFAQEFQRFTAEDPLEFGAGDPNLHAYVFNDPINFVDPTGEAIMSPPGCGDTPGSRKFSIPFLPLWRFLFGDRCDPADLLPTPLGAAGPLKGPLKRLGKPLRRGPSGKPIIHNVDHPTKKAAKDAARSAGQGAPMHHPSPSVGKPHYHPTDANGAKIPDGVHYNYLWSRR